MDPFLAQLTDLCRVHATRAKWVFVPAHAIGRTFGDRLVLAGTDWVNLRFVTPFEIALRMGAPFLVERGIDPSEEGLGPALMMRLLLDLPDRDGYFRPLASQPSMAAALWSSLRELRMAGVRSVDLKPQHFGSSLKQAELVALLAAYESFLTTHARGDRATVFQEALQHVNWCPIQPPDLWTSLPDVAWSPLEQQLFAALPGERVVPQSIAAPGMHLPRRFAVARVSRPVEPSPPGRETRATAVSFPVDRLAPAKSNALAFLTQPDASSAQDDKAVRLFQAGSSEAEIEAVFRQILANAVPLDRVEIVCAAPAYAPLVWEKALRYDWPVTIAQGVDATLTRPGRTLLAFIDWVEDDFPAGRLRRMLTSGEMRLDEETGIAPGRAARLLAQAEAAWGRDTYRLALTRLGASSQRAAVRDDLSTEKRDALTRRATEAAALAGWIEGLLKTIPVPDATGRIDLQAMASAVRDFVHGHAARISALDHVAATAISDSITELQALGSFRCTLRDALRFIRERVKGVTIAADRPRPGHLFISDLRAASISGRPHVFVVGLEEGRVFPLAIEDPVLLDSERTQIHPALPRSADHLEEAVHAALARLAMIGADSMARVTLSFACRDVREYRQTFPSWILLQAFRAVSGNPTATFHDLQQRLGEPVSIVPAKPDGSLDASRWWLRGVTQVGEAARDSILARYGSLAAGLRAQARRESSDFTEYDGHVPAAGAALDPGLPGSVISPTQLEEAAECPFRHFLKRGLGLNPIDAGERDRDVWLNPLLRGSLLHDLYAGLLRRCRAEGRRADVARDASWLRDEGIRRLKDLAIEMPAPSEEVRNLETSLLLDDLALFVEAEAKLPMDRTPIGFEVAFGRTGEADGEPLAQADPVVIDFGAFQLRIAGRIDRIDQVGPSRFEIVDYKTGSFHAPAWNGTFAGGTRLQHALYGLAAAHLLRQRLDPKAIVAGAEYYFSSERGRQERKKIPAPSLAAVTEVLSDLRQVIASGLFVHTPSEEACQWCQHRLACGRGVHGQARPKLADSLLAPFTRLMAHE